MLDDMAGAFRVFIAAALFAIVIAAVGAALSTPVITFGTVVMFVGAAGVAIAGITAVVRG